MQMLIFFCTIKVDTNNLNMRYYIFHLDIPYKFVIVKDVTFLHHNKSERVAFDYFGAFLLRIVVHLYAKEL